MSKPIDKKLYKGTNPSCHDFNAAGATAEGAQLLVGFTTGQIQLVHPGRREPGNKLYNEEVRRDLLCSEVFVCVYFIDFVSFLSIKHSVYVFTSQTVLSGFLKF